MFSLFSFSYTVHPLHHCTNHVLMTYPILLFFYVSSTKEKFLGTKIIESIHLDDFNLHGINRETHSGSKLFENRFLDILYDIDLFQLINEPTQIEGITLDLISTSCPDITYFLLCKSLSHHYPIAIQLPKNTIDHDVVSPQQYSKSSFDITAFIFALNDLYMLLYENVSATMASCKIGFMKWRRLLHSA